MINPFLYLWAKAAEAYFKVSGKKPVEEPIKTITMNGITVDFSKWNGNVNFAEMKLNNPVIDQVIMRAAEGNKNADSMFPTYYKECLKHDFPTAVYHFCTWNDSNEVADATSEAKFLVKILQAQGIGGAIRIWIDTESNKTNIILSREEMRTYLNTFIEVLAQNGYNNPGIYAGKGFVQAHYPINHNFGKYPLWVASYNGKSKPTMPPGWGSYELWQYTDKGQVRGCKTRVDLNRRP